MCRAQWLSTDLLQKSIIFHSQKLSTYKTYISNYCNFNCNFLHGPEDAMDRCKWRKVIKEVR